MIRTARAVSQDYCRGHRLTHLCRSEWYDLQGPRRQQQPVRTLGVYDLSRMIAEICRSTDALYNTIRAVKADGHTFDELQAATGLARGTLQNIVAGRGPRL